MPFAKCARHPTQLQKLSERIKRLEAQWADRRPLNVGLRPVEPFARLHFGRRRFSIPILAGEVATFIFGGTCPEHHVRVNCSAQKRWFP